MEIDIKIHSLVIPIEIAQICNPATAIVYAVMLDATNDGIATMSNSDIGKKSGVPSRSVPSIISKLETLGLIERHYNQGYATSYYVKNIFLKEDIPAEQADRNPPEPEPARRSERCQTYQPNSVEYVWRSSNGGLKQGYKWYGKRQKVALTDDEYQALCKEYGESVVKDYIRRIDTHCAKNGKYYPDYGATIEDWIEHDDRRIKETQTGKDKPISSKKKKLLDEYASLSNKFKDDVTRQEMSEIGEYTQLVNRIERNK